jgi:hypothetical protein
LEFNRFDVSAKELVWEDPEGWLARFGRGPLGPVEVIDSDITALTAAADKVLRVGGPAPYLVNIELQSGHDSELARTLWFRQAALDYRHGLPVHTVLVLLRREANSPALTGTYDRSLPDGRPTNRYNYDVVRAWSEPADSFLGAGVGLVPLAPLGDVAEAELPGLVRRMAGRINALPPPRAATLWTATYLLMGLRYDDDLISHLLGGVQEMQESVTYQKILREGEAKGRAEGRAEGRAAGRAEGEVAEARRLVIVQGTRRFGTPDPDVAAAIEAMNDKGPLEALAERIVDPDVRSWDDLLGRPKTRRRGRPT